MTDLVKEVPEKRYLVQVNYKSGHRVEMWCEEFNVKHDGGELVSVSYTTTGSNTTAKPLYFGKLDTIESIFQVNCEVVVSK